MHTFVDVMERITGTEKMYMKTDLCYRNHRRCKKQKKRNVCRIKYFEF